jgi:imidazolonepropionase-like amidohydrolase
MQDKVPCKFLLLLFGILIFAGCFPLSEAQKGSALKKNLEPTTFVITNVNVIPMTAQGIVLQNATVVVENARIVSLNGPAPDQAKVIDGKGKWLIPGLVDMHVHVPVDISFGAKSPTRAATLFFNTQDLMTPFIANGVTTIFELTARPEHFAQRNQIARGEVIGPRMALAALINGGSSDGRIANTASDGRQTVRMAKAEGYEFIKVYSQLNVETFRAIVDEAAKQGMKVIGHIPNAFKGRLKDAFVPNFGMVAHAEEYAKQSDDFSARDAEQFARFAKDNGTWLTPTLTTMVSIASQARSLDKLKAMHSLQYVHPILQSKWLTANNYNNHSDSGRVAHMENVVRFNSMLVKVFKAAGIPIVAGTDTGVSGVVAGFSLHDELQLLVGAGLTPEEALTSATRLPAVWLGTDSQTGTIEVGKYADLVLLDSNPLLDIRNTRKIAGVFVNGRWLDKFRINGMLDDLSRRNSESRNNFDWSERKNY